MPRVVILIGAALVAITTLAIVVFGALWIYLPQSELISRAVENYLVETTGLKVSVKSSNISYSFPSIVSVSLVGLLVTDSDNNPIFSSDTLTLSPSMKGLLKREFIIKSMILDGFSTSVSRDAGGNITIPIIVAYKTVAGNLIKEKPKNGEAKNQTVTSDEQNRFDDIRDQFATHFNWRVQTIHFTNGRVDWIDRKDSPRKEIVISLTDISGFLSHTSLDETISLDLNAYLRAENTDRANVKIQGSVGMDWPDTSVRTAKLDISSKSLHTGLFSPYLRNIPVALNIRGVELQAALSLEPSSDSTKPFYASVVARSPEGFEFKFTSIGNIKDPFSLSPFLDLTAELSARADWLKSVGANGVREWQVSGPAIVKAKLKGNFDQLIVDAEADCTQMSLSWCPTLLSCGFNAEKATAGIRVARIGSQNVSFDGNASLTLNCKYLPSNTSKENNRWRIEGLAPIAVKFSGDPSKINWSLNTDLERVQFIAANGFRKQDGERADLQAAGKWSQVGLTVNESLLRAQGLRVKAKGLLMDKNDRFGRLDIDMETENVASLLSYDQSISKLGISGALKVSMLAQNSASGILNSGRIHITSVNCLPDKALWGLQNMSGSLEFRGQTATIRDLTGKATGYVEAPFRLNGTFRDVGSLRTLTGSVSLKVSQGKVTADRIVQILTQSHSLIGNVIKPRPVSMKGVFIQFDEVLADLIIKSGKASTVNFRMKGQEITSAAIGSLEIGPLELTATLGIRTNVVGSEPLEAVPIIGELMQRHRDSLLKIPVTVFTRLSGPLLSGLGVTPLQNRDIDRSTLEKLEALMKE